MTKKIDIKAYILASQEIKNGIIDREFESDKEMRQLILDVTFSLKDTFNERDITYAEIKKAVTDYLTEEINARRTSHTPFVFETANQIFSINGYSVFIEDNNKLEENKQSLLTALEEIDVRNADVETIIEIISSIHKKHPSFAEKATETLAKNVTLKLDKINTKNLPLSKLDVARVEAFLNLNEYIQKNKGVFTNYESINTILSDKNPTFFQQLLLDNYQVNRLENQKNDEVPSKFSKHLTHSDYEFIALFDLYAIKAPTTHCFTQQSNKLSDLLETNIGNMLLNKQLNTFKKENDFLAEKYRSAITQIQKFTYKSRHHKYFAHLLKKTERALKKNR